MNKHFDKSKAVSVTRLSQVGFVLLACGAAAVAYVGVPLAQPPTEKDFAIADTGSVTPTTPQDSGPRTDMVGSASRLGRVSNAPRIVLVEGSGGEETSAPEIKSEPGLSNVKYLGFASVGSLRLALLNVNSKQRFVREGQLLDAERVKLIEPDAVTLSKDESERRIPLEERTGERITRVRGGTVTAATAQQPGVARINGIQAPKAMGGGVRGLSHLPDEYMNWPPAYQRRFDRVVNGLLQQGSFSNETELIEKAKAAMETDGFNPNDKEAMMKLEEMDQAEKKVPGKNIPQKQEK
jgi:hypothetical protein